MEARKAPAAHGWLWIRQAFELFRRSPLLWMLLIAIGVVGMAFISYIPLIGSPLSNILMPALLGGFMLGARDLERGGELELKYLTAGLRSNAQGLITLGGINLIAQVLSLGAITMMGGGALVGLVSSGRRVENPEIVAHALAGAGPAIVVGTLLFGLLLMAMQFAPMLVIFERMAPLQAMKTSLRACLRNLIPLTIYGVILLPFTLIASIIPIGLGWVILLPVIIASMYTIYIDLFPPQQTGPQTIEGEVVSGGGNNEPPPQS